jgi:pyruvate,orthophosphate dikinase
VSTARRFGGGRKKASTRGRGNKAAARAGGKPPRRVYSFGDGRAQGRASMRETLGGKGANLAEMSRLGIPVPPGFTISTDACAETLARGGRLGKALRAEILAALAKVEKRVGVRIGDSNNPLLVSVRSGARVSMPGMMDTVLNLASRRGAPRAPISRSASVGNTAETRAA